MTVPLFHKPLRLTAFILLCFLELSCLNDSNQHSSPSSEEQHNSPSLPPDSLYFLNNDFQNTDPSNFYEAWMAIPPHFLDHHFAFEQMAPKDRMKLWTKGRTAEWKLLEIDSLNGYLRYNVFTESAEIQTVVCFHKVYDLKSSSESDPFPVATKRILIAHNYIGDFTATLQFFLLEAESGKWVDRKTPVLPLIRPQDMDVPYQKGRNEVLHDYLEEVSEGRLHSYNPWDFLRWQLPRNGKDILVAPGKINSKEGLPPELAPFTRTTDKTILYENSGMYSPKGSRLGEALREMPLEFLAVDSAGQSLPFLSPERDSPVNRGRLISRNMEIQGRFEIRGRQGLSKHSGHLVLSRFALDPFDLIFLSGNAGPDQPLTYRCIAKRGRDYSNETASRFPPLRLPHLKDLYKKAGLPPDSASFNGLELLPFPEDNRIELATRSPSSKDKTTLQVYRWDGKRFVTEPKPAPGS